MRARWIKAGIATGVLTAGSLSAEILYEKDGIALEGSVRMVHRNAATCQVLAENESHEAYERTKVNHGQPLHVWRLDYSALNGSGRSLSDLTAHFQIDADWPPCTNWTGLGQYPGPVQWAGSFETLQRTAGLRPGEEAAATAYVLAIDGQQPRFGRRQVTYRFGSTSGGALEPQPSVEPSPGPEALPRPEPVCKGPEEERPCWEESPAHPGCYVWNERFPGYAMTWTGGCEDGLASGPGILTWTWKDTDTIEEEGLLSDGKKHGHWVERRETEGLAYPTTEKGSYVNGKRHGRWVESFGGDGFWRAFEGSYVDGVKHGRWTDTNSRGRADIDEYVYGERQD